MKFGEESFDDADEDEQNKENIIRQKKDYKQVPSYNSVKDLRFFKGVDTKFLEWAPMANTVFFRVSK